MYTIHANVENFDISIRIWLNSGLYEGLAMLQGYHFRSRQLEHLTGSPLTL